MQISHCGRNLVVTAIIALGLLPVAGVGVQTPGAESSGAESLPPDEASGKEQAGKGGDDLDKLMSIDIDLNKRNYINRNSINRNSDYRSEAAAVGVSATANY